MTAPERIGGEVKRELRRFGGEGDIAAVVSAWPEVVGDAIARNSWPARIARDGTLHVAASSSTWAFELTQLSGSILPRLRESLGQSAPKALKFAVGQVPEAPALIETEVDAKPLETGPAERAAGASLAAEIESEPLREAVARAAAASLARRCDDRSVC